MTENGVSTHELEWTTLRSEAETFITSIDKFAVSVGLDTSGLEIDHIGLRVANPENVGKLAEKLDRESIGRTHLSKAVVNGRPIMIYELSSPIKIGEHTIPCVELPYPSNNHDFPRDGWEHAEFVIPSEASSGDEFLKEFREMFPSYNGDLKVDSPKVEGEQLANPTIIIRNPEDKMQCIKFHPRPIKEIVLTKKSNFTGRGGEIRTHDLPLPKRTLYQLSHTPLT